MNSEMGLFFFQNPDGFKSNHNDETGNNTSSATPLVDNIASATPLLDNTASATPLVNVYFFKGAS